MNFKLANRLKKLSPNVKAAIPLLVVSGLLMVAWSLVVPVFESPDELAHWQYARYVRHYKRLPPFTKDLIEANSPPLYYILVSPFATHSPGPPAFMWLGSGGVEFAAAPRYAENTNADFHRYWPVRITRLATVAISLVTVLFCYLGALEATGRIQTALLAGGVAGFLPEFSFRGMSISNDALVAALGAVLVYFIIRFVRRGSTVTSRIVAAIALSAAFLSKINAIFFPLPLALSMLSGSEGLKKRLGRLWVFAISLVIASPWLIRNQVKYGDPFASRAMQQVVDYLVTRTSLSSPYFRKIFAPLLARSYVAGFGWMNLWAPERVYKLFAAFGLLACIGLAIGICLRKIQFKIAALLILTLALNLAVVVYINLTFNQPQGRYMFPSLAAAAVLSALGLEALPYWGKVASIVALAGMLMLNLYLLIRVVYPAYWPAPMPDISTAAVALKFSSTTHVSPGEDGSHFVITGDNPRLTISTDKSTEALYFLAFNISGPLSAGLQTGAIYLTFVGEAPSARVTLPFHWRGNGSSGAVYVPLFNVPSWKGRVSSISIEPFAGGAEKYKGMTIAISNPRLLGVISWLRDRKATPVYDDQRGVAENLHYMLGCAGSPPVLRSGNKPDCPYCFASNSLAPSATPGCSS